MKKGDENTEITRDEVASIESAVDQSRRDFVAKTVKASAFAVPLALGVDTITARKVHAQQTSGSADSGGTGATSSTAGGGGAAQSGAASVSEPAAVTLLGLGLASLALEARRRKKKQS